MRRTFAPKPAKNLVATGPARTRVKSKTWTPASGRSCATWRGSLSSQSVSSRQRRGSSATLRPCGCARQEARGRIAAAHPPWFTTASSSSSARQPGDRGFHLGLVRLDPEDHQRGVTVMWGVGVQPDPAVRSRVVSGNGIPDRHGPPLRLQGHAEPERRKSSVDLHSWRAARVGHELSYGQTGGRNGRRREIAHRERGRQSPVAVDFDALECSWLASHRSPDLSQQAGGGLVELSCPGVYADPSVEHVTGAHPSHQQSGMTRGRAAECDRRGRNAETKGGYGPEPVWPGRVHPGQRGS